jgi:hypothetical protein
MSIAAVEAYAPKDDFYGKPYVDRDETRDAPLPLRYLHGGFEGTDARFSMYLPPADVYRGRLLQTFAGALGGDEYTAETLGLFSPIEVAFSHGAYLVVTNQGHLGADLSGLRGDLTVLNGRTDAEAARLSHAIAEELYGARPHHGYCFGGSGAGGFTLRCLELAPDIWQGGAPFMYGGTDMSVLVNAFRVLEPVVDGVIDAMQVGGSGDPFAGLNTEQREALATLYRMGFQRGAEWQLKLPAPEITWTATAEPGIPGLYETDPSYFEDFWSVPGHAGADGELAHALVEAKASVAKVVTVADLASRVDAQAGETWIIPMVTAGLDPAATFGLLFDDGLDTNLTGAKVTFTSGKAAGRTVYIGMMIGGVLLPSGRGSFFDVSLLEGVAEGDEVQIDNRDWLAFCYLHRHRPFRDLHYRPLTVAGMPVYPFRRHSGGIDVPFTGKFAGKIILQQHMHDRPCWPAMGVIYQAQVREHLGDAIDDQFRLWFTDNATHIPSMPGFGDPTLSIDYFGCVAQAVRDVIAWVEDGVAPAPSTSYDYVDGQVLMPASAAARGGIQPVVRASANGAERAEVAVGAPVTLSAEAEVPPGTGGLVSVEWDFDGSGAFAFKHDDFKVGASQVSVSTTHTYDAPGTYFATVRVRAHREGDASASGPTACLVENIRRARVVVS